MKMMGRISIKDQKTRSGVGFDQHYTDSALKLLAPGSYGRHGKWVRTRGSVPKQEVLVSLLLFGKAYLSRPTWLYELRLPEGFPELERFEEAGLVEWIPTLQATALAQPNDTIRTSHVLGTPANNRRESRNP